VWRTDIHTNRQTDRHADGRTTHVTAWCYLYISVGRESVSPCRGQQSGMDHRRIFTADMSNAIGPDVTSPRGTRRKWAIDQLYRLDDSVVTSVCLCLCVCMYVFKDLMLCHCFTGVWNVCCYCSLSKFRGLDRHCTYSSTSAWEICNRPKRQYKSFYFRIRFRHVVELVNKRQYSCRQKTVLSEIFFPKIPFIVLAENPLINGENASRSIYNCFCQKPLHMPVCRLQFLLPLFSTDETNFDTSHITFFCVTNLPI